MFLIAEVLCHRKSGLRHAHTRSGRLVHLSEHKGCLLQHAGLFHLGPQVISLTGTLPDSGENGVPAVLGGDVSYQLLDEHGLSYSGAAEETDFSALCIRRQEVDYLDSGLQYLDHRTLVFKCGRLPVDNPLLGIGYLFSVINGLAEDIEQPAQRLLAHRHFDAGACGSHFHVPVEPLACRQHQAAHLVVPQVGCNFHDAGFSVVFHFQRIFDKGKFSVFKYYVNDRSHDLCNSSFIHTHSHFPFCMLTSAAPLPRRRLL